MMRVWTLVVAAVCALFAQPVSAQEAVVLWDTYPYHGPTNKNRLVGCNVFAIDCDDVLTDESQQWADWFQVEGDHTLDAVTLRLGSSSGNVVVRLWNDDGMAPGNVLEELPPIPGPFGPPPSFEDLTTQSQTEPLLLDGEIYWISVSMEDPLGLASWLKADLANPPPAPLVSDELLFARTAGTAGQWFQVGFDEGDVDGDGGPPDALPGAYFGVMKVTGIPVPEPASLLAHGAALAAVGLLVRARRRQAAHAPLREIRPRS